MPGAKKTISAHSIPSIPGKSEVTMSYRQYIQPSSKANINNCQKKVPKEKSFKKISIFRTL